MVPNTSDQETKPRKLKSIIYPRLHALLGSISTMYSRRSRLPALLLMSLSIIVPIIFATTAPATLFEPAYEDRFCPPEYLSCATINEWSVCCPTEYTCQYDDSGVVACCKFRSDCRGSLASASAAAGNHSFTQSDATSGAPRGSAIGGAGAGGWYAGMIVAGLIVIPMVVLLEWWPGA